jgi:hypothetical protein
MTRIRKNRQLAFLAAGVLACWVVATSAGCCCRSREDYRLQADEEAEEIVCEKSEDSRWGIDEFTIEMDPRSRYFDGTDPDCPPMPEDDPASHEFMHCVGGHKAWKHWHDNGEVTELENPQWREYLGKYTERADDGAIKLRLNDAVRLSLIHSPSYQQQIETIYLSALDVSTERFRFDVQFFGSTGPIYQHLGSERAGGEQHFTIDTEATMENAATAGKLLVGSRTQPSGSFSTRHGTALPFSTQPAQPLP